MQHLTPDHPETQSQDGLAQNLTRLHDLFPEAFSEGRLNFDVLKELLGDQIDDQPEKYGLTWNGKARARRHALTPTRATLRPDPASSVDWDTTQNLMIEGDNLEVLKLLQRSYAGKVKLIYIDPPYNTGKDFVYPDNYTDSLKNYQELTGQLEEGRRVSSNTESSGRFHTDWLNMMYPRLKLARELLRDDGVIFVSIDDSEVANLRKIMDEIFGEDGYIESIAWKNKYGSGALTKGFASVHESILVYSAGIINNISAPLNDEQRAAYNSLDEKSGIRGGYLTQPLATKSKDDRPNLVFPIIHEGIEIWPDKQWIWSRERVEEAQRNNELVINNSRGKYSVRMKQYLRDSDGKERLGKPISMMNGPFNQAGTKDIEDIKMSSAFSFPKPLELVRHFLKFVINDIGSHDDIILDFFAGSGTTGHAVMAQNAADGGNRQFILVQLPEPLDPAKAEQKTAADFCDSLGVPRNIAELTKERLRRAGAKVKAEHPDWQGDTGFRVFKLDSSNVAAWDGDAARQDVQAALLSAEDNIKAGRTDRDVLYEVLLKLGLPLTTPIEERTIAGLKVQLVGGGALVACLERHIAAAQVQELGQGMADWLTAENPAGEAHLLFLDSAFENDNAKLNLSKYLSQRAEVLGRNWVVRSI